jgi:hypothetical protein
MRAGADDLFAQWALERRRRDRDGARPDDDNELGSTP